MIDYALVTAALLCVVVFIALVRYALRQQRDHQERAEREWREHLDRMAALMMNRQAERETFVEWARRTHPQGKAAFPTPEEKLQAQRAASEAFRRRAGTANAQPKAITTLPGMVPAPCPSYGTPEDDFLRNHLALVASTQPLPSPPWSGDGGSFSGGGASGAWDSSPSTGCTPSSDSSDGTCGSDP